MNELFDIPADSMMGGLTIYNEGNLDISQFTNIKKLTTIPARVDATTFYYKVCSISLKRNDSYLTSKFFIFRHDNNASRVSEYMEVVVKAGVGGVLGSGTRQVNVLLKDAKVLTTANLKYVVVQDDANGYVIDVYFLHYEASASYQVQKQIEKSNTSKANVTFYDNQTCVTLPGGTLAAPKHRNKLRVVQVWYDGAAWNCTYLEGGTGSATGDLGTPIWDADGVRFPDGSVILNSDTKILGVRERYITSTSLAYVPIVNYNSYTTLKKIAFFDRATGNRVTTLSTQMSLYLTFEATY